MTLRMRGFERTPGGSFECCVVVCRCCACLMHLLCLSDWVHSAFEEIYESGRARSIGVSNYLIPHLEELQSARVLPFVNQVEFHPQLFQKELLAYCQEKGIQVEVCACPFFLPALFVAPSFLVGVLCFSFDLRLSLP
eukprot:m.164768 g.164768  ORF g.164768 m.164768 type:complete len:137 (+) comp53106_c0_seq27:384-794(+)